MALITHPATGFAVGDPDRSPLSRPSLPAADRVREASASLILSASGWRKIFAQGGEEDSPTERVSPEDLVLAGAAAIAFAGFLEKRRQERSPARTPGVVLVGIDTRPTGPTLADAMIRVFMALGLEPRYLFIVPAPELIAYAGRAFVLPPGHEEHADAFCYVSASHNPRGHNGLKFGAAGSEGGGVLNADEMAPLIAGYRGLLDDQALPERVFDLMAGADRRELGRIYAACSGWKRRSASAYTLFSREVITGRHELDEQESLFDEMSLVAERRRIGIVADLNGSARCLSIDRDFLTGIGIEVRSVNDSPRDFAHRIVPEGEGLDQCRLELEAAHEADPAFLAGYVPDCDGDRGNLVWYDSARGCARQIEAQEVFALCCVAELAQLVRNGQLDHDESGNARQKVAVVVNDATSMRVNAVARAFDVDVYRSETGEANVVGLAAQLRARGYLVRILGEGSNGGNITHPSAVRDPLATLGALLKLLLLRDGFEGGEGLFRIWMRLSGRLSEYRADFGLGDVLRSLPEYRTTSVFESRALMRLRERDPAALKSRYGAIFRSEWESRRAELASRFGVVSWEALASSGQREFSVGTEFGEAGSGGLRIVLLDESGRPRAFLWMRGSGTEPVLRMMADVEGGREEDEAYLLGWQEGMLRSADLAEAGPRR
ncbi:MAG TPA: phosphatidylglycerol lysyltransferase [Rectinemataceae bacterium]|nr:phosphatidylglycerol lysyltransferase [Rectinemataceae bacterium]